MKHPTISNSSGEIILIKFQISKGNVMTVAQVAGILAAKRTSDLIPLCHPIQLNKVDVKCQLIDSGLFFMRYLISTNNSFWFLKTQFDLYNLQFFRLN